jgi:hypothetical protein
MGFGPSEPGATDDDLEGVPPRYSCSSTAHLSVWFLNSLMAVPFGMEYKHILARNGLAPFRISAAIHLERMSRESDSLVRWIGGGLSSIPEFSFGAEFKFSRDREEYR